ncbi:MAG: hypothetical protein LUD74_02650 [Tannerellaceae bacterium]|nr:hypothetical protein [Tannerellaceae bacterium]
MRNILLDNINVNAKANPKPRPQLKDAFFKRFTNIHYTYEDIEKHPYNDAVSLIRRIPEVRIISERSTAEDVPVFMNRKKRMCILLDDIQMPDDYNIRNLNIREIESIGIIASNTAGTRWLNPPGRPAIVITTKRQDTSYHTPKIYPGIEVMPLGFQQPLQFTMPDYKKEETAKEPKPDLRTTIYWNPHVALNNNGEGTFSFYTAAQPGSYSMIIEGISNEGYPIYLKEQLIVE